MPDTKPPTSWEKWRDMLFGKKVLEQLASPPKEAPPPMQNYDYVKGSIAQWQAEQARLREEEAKKKAGMKK